MLGVCRLQLHFNPCCFNKLLGLPQLLGLGPFWSGCSTGAKERTAGLKSVQPELTVQVMGWKTGHREAHGAVAAREASAYRLAKELPVLCRVWWCEAVGGSELAVCVAPCALRFALACVALCDGRCCLPTPRFPRSVAPWVSHCFWWHLDVACPGFASCLWLSLVYRTQHGRTGSDDVLFPSQFPPFPARQDRLLVGRQG